MCRVLIAVVLCSFTLSAAESDRRVAEWTLWMGGREQATQQAQGGQHRVTERHRTPFSFTDGQPMRLFARVKES